MKKELNKKIIIFNSNSKPSVNTFEKLKYVKTNINRLPYDTFKLQNSKSNKLLFAKRNDNAQKQNNLTSNLTNASEMNKIKSLKDIYNTTSTKITKKYVNVSKIQISKNNSKNKSGTHKRSDTNYSLSNNKIRKKIIINDTLSNITNSIQKNDINKYLSQTTEPNNNHINFYYNSSITEIGNQNHNVPKLKMLNKDEDISKSQTILYEQVSKTTNNFYFGKKNNNSNKNINQIITNNFIVNANSNQHSENLLQHYSGMTQNQFYKNNKNYSTYTNTSIPNSKKRRQIKHDNKSINPVINLDGIKNDSNENSIKEKSHVENCLDDNKINLEITSINYLINNKFIKELNEIQNEMEINLKKNANSKNIKYSIINHSLEEFLKKINCFMNKNICDCISIFMQKVINNYNDIILEYINENQKFLEKTKKLTESLESLQKNLIIKEKIIGNLENENRKLLDQIEFKKNNALKRNMSNINHSFISLEENNDSQYYKIKKLNEKNLDDLDALYFFDKIKPKNKSTNKKIPILPLKVKDRESQKHISKKNYKFVTITNLKKKGVNKINKTFE